MVLAILQARTSSTRLPGKVLAPLHGEPLIVRALERISGATLVDRLVLATSVDSTDDELADVVERAGYDVQRGSLDDVLARFVHVVDSIPDADPTAMHIVRLTGDNALIDPAVIDQVVGEHLASGADYTSNVLERTFPRGQDVEAFTAATLRAIDAIAEPGPEREHVTLGIYQRPERFSLHSVTQSPDRSALRWSVDEPADLEFARAVYDRLYDQLPAFGQREIYALLEESPELSRHEPGR